MRFYKLNSYLQLNILNGFEAVFTSQQQIVGIVMMRPSLKLKRGTSKQSRLLFEDLINAEYQQIQVMVAKYDIIINYLKQLNLIISVTIRQYRPQTIVFLKQIIHVFDKAIEDYNNYYVSIRLKHALYFSIESHVFHQWGVNKLNMFTNANQYRNLFVHMDNTIPMWQGQKGKSIGKNIEVDIRSIPSRNFILNMVFTKIQQEDPELVYNQKYYIHIQIWKKASNTQQENQILSRFQNIFTFQLMNKLLQQGYVDHFKPNHCVALKLKKSKISSITHSLSMSSQNNNVKDKKKTQELNVFEKMEEQCRKYVDELNKIFSQKLECLYCHRCSVYDSKTNNFVPPTIKLQKSINHEGYYHQICALRYLVPLKKRDDR